MPDASSSLWTLGSVALGGILTLIGSLVADHFRSKRELRREERILLREQLYALQDQVATLFDLTRAYVRAKDDRFNPTGSVFLDNTEIKNQILRIGMNSVRVEDDPLAENVDATTKHLFAATYSTTGDLSEIQEAHSHVQPLQLRIGELLHTNAHVDLGTGSDEK